MELIGTELVATFGRAATFENQPTSLAEGRESDSRMAARGMGGQLLPLELIDRCVGQLPPALHLPPPPFAADFQDTGRSRACAPQRRGS